MSAETVLWLIVLAAIAHVAEEYATGFVDKIGATVPGMTWRQFWVINALFVALCLAAAILNVRAVVFSLSAAGLVLINALIHIGASVVQRRYASGTVTAIFLYIPLGTYTCSTYARAGLAAPGKLITALLLGAGWMAAPLLVQAVRLRRAAHVKR
jgi:hypothetical protein